MDTTDAIITEIRVTMARLEEKIDNMSDTKTTAILAKEKADEALNSTKSAHLRLDKLDRIVFWATTTVIGLVLAGLIGLLIANGGN